MKRKIGFGIALSLLLAVAALGVAQVVKAEAWPPTQTPGSRAQGFGEMGRGQGLLEPYMEEAMAEAFGLTEAEFDALHQSGTTLWAYAAEQGFSADEIRARMEAARDAALQAAMADGVLSSEQAEWMQSHTPGGPMFDAQGFQGRGRGYRNGGQGFAPNANGMPGYGQGGFDGQCPWGQTAPNAQP